MHRNGLNPITSFKIYKSIVLPRALFGCEMLQSLSERDNLILERSHRLCLKQIQGLKSRSRTYIVLSLLGAFPMKADIPWSVVSVREGLYNKTSFSSTFMFIQ